MASMMRTDNFLFLSLQSDEFVVCHHRNRCVVGPRHDHCPGQRTITGRVCEWHHSPHSTLCIISRWPSVDCRCACVEHTATTAYTQHMQAHTDIPRIRFVHVWAHTGVAYIERSRSYTYLLRNAFYSFFYFRFFFYVEISE